MRACAPLPSRFWLHPTCQAVPGTIKSVPGKSCKSIKDQLKDKAKSGLFWVNPAGKQGETLQVWCEHEWKGGGWTLFLHTHQHCARDERSKYAQNFADWVSVGAAAECVP